MSSNEIIVRQIVKKRQGKRIEIEIQLAEKISRIFFQSNTIKLSPNLNSTIAIVLLPAMKSGARIVAKGNVSRKFYSNLQSIMEIFSTWDSTYTKVDIQGMSLVEEKNIVNNRVGLFFSGGVDSFYSLLQKNDEITDLIYFEEMDKWRGHEEQLQQRTAQIRQIAFETGKDVVVLETNLRSFLKEFVHWNFAHGAALAAIGHLLSNHFSKILISSTHTYNELHPLGSHPLLDPLWSSEQLEFVHYGADKTRVEKVASIANHPIALQNLRVCGKDLVNNTNCCQCGKCIRTMFNLKLAGALEQSTAFPRPLDPIRVARIGNIEGGKIAWARANITGMKKIGGDKVLIRALEWAVIQSFLFEKSKNILRKFPRFFQLLKKIKSKIS